MVTGHIPFQQLWIQTVHCSMVLQRIILQALGAQVAESVLFPPGFLSMPKGHSRIPQVSPGNAGPCSHPLRVRDKSCLRVLSGCYHAHLNLSPKCGPRSSSMAWWAGWLIGQGAHKTGTPFLWVFPSHHGRWCLFCPHVFLIDQWVTIVLSTLTFCWVPIWGIGWSHCLQLCIQPGFSPKPPSPAKTRERS